MTGRRAEREKGRHAAKGKELGVELTVTCINHWVYVHGHTHILEGQATVCKREDGKIGRTRTTDVR